MTTDLAGARRSGSSCATHRCAEIHPCGPCVELTGHAGQHRTTTGTGWPVRWNAHVTRCGCFHPAGVPADCCRTCHDVARSDRD